MPIHYGKNQSGMQAKEELAGWRLAAVKGINNVERYVAITAAWMKIGLGLHKQVANRYLEPWQYISVIYTATEWDNFFALRCHPDAQPEFQELAREMEHRRGESVPVLRPWTGDPEDRQSLHLPYVSDVERWNKAHTALQLFKLSTARNARVSYLTHDGAIPDLLKDFGLHDRLVGSVPIHASPTEHCAMASVDSEMHKNFRGWHQYRELVESTTKEKR